MIAFSSSCKQDDDLQTPTADVNVMKRSSFNGEILPIIEKECSNSGCHSVGSKANLLVSSYAFNHMINDGTIHHRLLVIGSPTPCSNVNPSSLAILKAWFAKESAIE